MSFGDLVGKVFVDIIPRVSNSALQGLKGTLTRSLQSAFRGPSESVKKFQDSFNKFSTKKFAQEAIAASRQFSVLIAKANLVGTALQGIVTSIGGVVGALGSMVAAVGAASASLAVLPGLLGAMVQGGAAAVIAFKGIGGAVSAGFQEARESVSSTGKATSDSAAKSASALKAIEAAQKNLADVQLRYKRQLSDAERDYARTRRDSQEDIRSSAKDVADAEKELKNAENEVSSALIGVLRSQENLTRARREAREELEDLSFSVRGSVLAEERAALRLEEALNEVNRARSEYDPNSAEFRDADLAYREAQLAYDEAVDRADDMGKANAEAAKSGIAGTQAYQDALNENIAAEKELADARQKVADQKADLTEREIQYEKDVIKAKEAVADAERDLNRLRRDSKRDIDEANKALRDAQREYRNLANSTDAASGGTDRFQEELAKLSPAAQTFVKALVAMRPRFTEFKKAIQEPFFREINKSFGNFVDKMLPALEKGLSTSAKTMGTAFGQIMDTLADGEGHKLFHDIMDANNEILKVFTKEGKNGKSTVENLLIVFLRLWKAIQPLTKQFAEWVGTLSAGWEETTRGAEGMKKLTDGMSRASEYAKVIGGALGELFGVIKDLGSALAPTGAGLFGDFEKSMEGLRGKIEKNETAIRVWAENGSGIMKSFGKASEGVFENLFSLDAIRQSREAAKVLEGLSDPLGKIAGATVGSQVALANLAVTVAEILAECADSGSIKLFTEILGVFADLVKGIIGLPFVKEFILLHGTLRAIGAAFLLINVATRAFTNLFTGGLIGIISKNIVLNKTLTATRNLLWGIAFLSAQPGGFGIGAAFTRAGQSVANMGRGLAKVPGYFAPAAGTATKFGGVVKGIGQGLLITGAQGARGMGAVAKGGAGALKGLAGMAGMLVGGGPIVGGAVLAGAAVYGWTKALDSARRPAEDIQGDFAKITDHAKNAKIASEGILNVKVRDDSWLGSASKVQDIGDALDTLEESTETNAFFLVWKEISDANFALDTVIDGMNDMVAINPEAAAKQWSALNEQFKQRGLTDEIGKIQGAREELEGLGYVLDENTGEWYLNTNSVEGNATAMRQANEAATRLTTAFDKMFGNLNVEQANKDFKDLIDSMVEIKLEGRKVPIDKVRELNSSWRTVADTMLKQGKSSEEITKAYRKMRQEVKGELKRLGFDGKDLMRELNRIMGKPARVTAKFDKEALDQETVDARRRIRRLARKQGISFEAAVRLMSSGLYDEKGRYIGPLSRYSNKTGVPGGNKASGSATAVDVSLAPSSIAPQNMRVEGSSIIARSTYGQTMGGYGPSIASVSPGAGIGDGAFGMMRGVMSSSLGAVSSQIAYLSGASRAAEGVSTFATAENRMATGLGDIADTLGNKDLSALFAKLLQDFAALVSQMVQVRTEYSAFDDQSAEVWNNQKGVWESTGKPTFDGIVSSVDQVSKEGTESFSGIRDGFVKSFAGMRNSWTASTQPWLDNTVEEKLSSPFDKFARYMLSTQGSGFLGKNQQAITAMKLIFTKGLGAIAEVFKTLPQTMGDNINPGLKNINEKIIEPMKATLRAYPGGEKYASRMTKFPQFASGGYVSGPGSGTSDSILAKISAGEFVMNAKQTKKYRKLLEMINKGKHMSRSQVWNYVFGAAGGPWWDDKGANTAINVLGPYKGTSSIQQELPSRGLGWVLDALADNGRSTVSRMPSLAMLGPIMRYGFNSLSGEIRKVGKAIQDKQEEKYLPPLIHPLGLNHPKAVGPHGPNQRPGFTGSTPVYNPGNGSYSAHTGADLSAALGDALYAVTSGEVIQAGYYGNAGNWVKILFPNGYAAGYAHLSKINVKLGQKIRSGQLIGRVGSTGNSTGPHLHFSVFDRSGNFIDPEVYFKKSGIALASGGYVSPRSGGLHAILAEAGKMERVEPLDSRGLSKRDKDIVDRLDKILAASGSGAISPQIRVFIGDQELRTVVRTEIGSNNRQMARKLGQGRRSTI